MRGDPGAVWEVCVDGVSSVGSSELPCLLDCMCQLLPHVSLSLSLSLSLPPPLSLACGCVGGVITGTCHSEGCVECCEAVPESPPCIPDTPTASSPAVLWRDSLSGAGGGGEVDDGCGRH